MDLLKECVDVGPDLSVMRKVFGKIPGERGLCNIARVEERKSGLRNMRKTGCVAAWCVVRGAW